MVRHLIMLPDGTEIFSGGSGAAVMGVKLTRSVNDGQLLTPGAACAALLEATLFDMEPGAIAPGDPLTLYQVDDHGQRTQLGIFLAEKPERVSPHTLRLTAYDRLTLLDRDLTGWLANLTGWPYTLHTLADMVCSQCGLTLVTQEIPNGDFPVEAFTAQGVTGRQIMMWIGQAACRFCRATPTGEVELAWYTPAPVSVGPSAIYMADATYRDGELRIRAADNTGEDGSIASAYVSVSDDGQGNVTLIFSDSLQQQCCFQGGLQLEEYVTDPVQKVQLRQDEEDIGTLWPADTDEALNTLSITGNPLLAARSAQALTPVAQTLYGQLKDICYTPGTLKLPAGQPIQPGSILQVTDPRGRQAVFYVMSSELSGQLDTLSCAGQATREDTTAFHDLESITMPGKVLRLRTDVDGIRAENADTSGRLARLELDVTGIRTQVESQQSQNAGLRTQLTALEQTAQGISATVQDITENGTSKVANEFGLTIDGSCVQIRRSGADMVNRLDEKGMYVVRGGGTGNETTMLQADAQGVIATDVTVRNYLVLGDHARFEDYADGTDSKRTACYFVGGK